MQHKVMARSHMRKPSTTLRAVRLAGCGLFCLALCVATGCSRSTSAPAPEATAPPPPVKVMTVAVSQRLVRRTTQQPATVHPFYESRISARVSGYLETVSVDIGDAVEPNTQLAVVAVPELEARSKMLTAQVAKAEVEETQAETSLKLAKARVVSAKAKLQQAQSESKGSDADLAAAEAEFQRTQDLVNRQSLEPRLLDEARRKRDAAVAGQSALQSAVTAAEANVIVAEAAVESASSDLLVAKAETTIAESRLGELTAQLGFAKLKAPFAGVVTERTAEPGELVGPEENPSLFVISSIETVRVRTSVPERDAAHVNPGDSITLTFPAFADEAPVEAKVRRTSASMNSGTRMMLVEAEVPNPDGKLLPGMFGQAQIELSADSEANVLPARAVRFREDGSAYVYAINDSTVSVVEVALGRDDGSLIQIVSGVESGQQVIDAHLQRFTDGQLVTVIE